MRKHIPSHHRYKFPIHLKLVTLDAQRNTFADVRACASVLKDTLSFTKMGMRFSYYLLPAFIISLFAAPGGTMGNTFSL